MKSNIYINIKDEGFWWGVHGINTSFDSVRIELFRDCESGREKIIEARVCDYYDLESTMADGIDQEFMDRYEKVRGKEEISFQKFQYDEEEYYEIWHYKEELNRESLFQCVRDFAMKELKETSVEISYLQELSYSQAVESFKEHIKTMEP